MTNPADYLSDSDCERMCRAKDARLWRWLDEHDTSGAASIREAALHTMRAAWSSRPESARRLDEAATMAAMPIEVGVTGVAIADAARARGRELLKASGGNSGEPSDNKSPTGGVT